MPRKDLTEERTAQILDALERCVVKYGLEGSSLEKIGDEAGMKRTILRHYIGNRDDLIHALCARVVGRWERQLKTLEAAPAGADPEGALLDMLFLDSGESSEDILIAESLIASAERYPEVGRALREYIGNFTRILERRLRLIHPGAAPAKRWKMAYGVTSILFNDVSLKALSLPGKYRAAARESVAALVRSLAE